MPALWRHHVSSEQAYRAAVGRVRSALRHASPHSRRVGLCVLLAKGSLEASAALGRAQEEETPMSRSPRCPKCGGPKRMKPLQPVRREDACPDHKYEAFGPALVHARDCPCLPAKRRN